MNFKRIYLEISNICNVQCSFCPIVERNKLKMSLQEIENIFHKVEAYTNEVCLHLMGEPTAYSELPEVLKLAESFDFKINLTTNGLLIKRYKDVFLESKSLRQVNFSLQAYKDNFPHKELTLYLNPIFNFVEKAMTQRPELYINFRLWNIGANIENDEILNAVEEKFNLTINREVDVGFKKSKNLLGRLYLHFDSRFEWPNITGEILSEQGRCHGLKSHIGIHADGTVVPCCLDKEAVINLGNIHKDNIQNILSSPMAMEIKHGFENGRLVHDLCKRCDYVSRFSKGKKHVSH